MSKQQRRRFSAQEKVKILRLYLLEDKAVSALCEEHGIRPSLFYTWQKQFFEHGARAFNGGRPERAESQLQKQVQALEQRLQRKHEVLSELLEEHLRLRKDLGEG
jgi:transposase-like protein